MIGSSLCALVAASFLGLGAGAWAAPKALSQNYGVPLEDAAGFAYVRALGARDAALGLLLVWCLATRAKGALGATIACSTLVACSDFAVVFATRGGAARAGLAIHGGGIAGLLFVSAALRLER